MAAPLIETAAADSPSRRDLQPGPVFPFDGPRIAMSLADNVGLQRIEDDGTVWATRGCQLLRLAPGAERFETVETLPSRDLLGILSRWQATRSRLRLDDMVKIIWLRSGTQIARTGGWLFRRAAGQRKFAPVHQLRRCGPRTGRGIFDRGFLETSAGRLIYGEYHNNRQREPVRLYASDDDGGAWDPIYEFPAGDIRHVHTLAEDPFTGHLYVATGDGDRESRIAVSTDGGTSFRVIGTGSQVWRTCELLFTPDAIYWGVDSGHAGFPGIWRWDRQTEASESLADLDGPVEYATQLPGNVFLFSVCRGGLECEWDPYPSLWVTHPGGQPRRLPLKAVRGPLPVQTGLRLVTSPSGAYLGVTLYNTNPYPFASLWTRSSEFTQFLQQDVP